MKEKNKLIEWQGKQVTLEATHRYKMLLKKLSLLSPYKAGVPNPQPLPHPMT